MNYYSLGALLITLAWQLPEATAVCGKLKDIVILVPLFPPLVRS